MVKFKISVSKTQLIYVRILVHRGKNSTSISLHSFSSIELQHLQISVHNWTTTLLRTLNTWYFPNLVILDLEHLSYEKTHHLWYTKEREIICSWISKNMPSLEYVNLRWFRMYMSNCVELAEKLKRLQTFRFCSLVSENKKSIAIRMTS